MTKSETGPTSTSRARGPKKGRESIDQSPAPIASRDFPALPGSVRAEGVPDYDKDGRPVALSKLGYQRVYKLEARKQGKFKTSSKGARRWALGQLVGAFLTLHGLDSFAKTEGVEIVGQLAKYRDSAQREHCARRERGLGCAVCGVEKAVDA